MKRWRAFLRACAQLIISSLPAEANIWIEAADAYEAGSLSLEALTGVRKRAWLFHDARRDTSDQAELSGLRVVMYRLWSVDSERDDWYDSAWHFLHFCDEAGLEDEQLFSLLRKHFAGYFSGAN